MKRMPLRCESCGSTFYGTCPPGQCPQVCYVCQRQYYRGTRLPTQPASYATIYNEQEYQTMNLSEVITRWRVSSQDCPHVVWMPDAKLPIWTVSGVAGQHCTFVEQGVTLRANGIFTVYDTNNRSHTLQAWRPVNVIADAAAARAVEFTPQMHATFTALLYEAQNLRRTLRTMGAYSVDAADAARMCELGIDNARKLLESTEHVGGSYVRR